jgi:hypothetical protein
MNVRFIGEYDYQKRNFTRTYILIEYSCRSGGHVKTNGSEIGYLRLSIDRKSHCPEQWISGFQAVAIRNGLLIK